MPPIYKSQSKSLGRSRIVDIALEAGVSTATVDRVLHQRNCVGYSTTQRVLRVALELGYLEENSPLIAVRKPPMRLVFLLPAGTNYWIRMLGDSVAIVERNLVPFNLKCRCVYIEGFNPEALARELRKHAEHADGLAFVALEHPLVREAVNHLADKGIHILTLVSDLSNSKRAAYVGVDNRAAGRTAGFLLGRFIGERRGKIAMIAGSLSYRGHEEREMGFHHIQQELFPHLQLIGVREGLDNQQRNYEQTRALLSQNSDLVGIYNIGGGSDGVARALKEANRDQKVVFIGHEITPDTRGFLIDGTMDAAINQNQQVEIMNAMRIFANLRESKEPLSGIEPVRISVVLRENLP